MMHKAYPHHARPRCRCVSTEVSAASCREISPVSRICCRVCSPPNAVSALIRCSVCCTRLASHIESVRRCRWIVSRRRGGFPVSVSTGRFVSYSRVMVSISCPMIRFRTRSLSSRRSNSSHKARKIGCRGLRTPDGLPSPGCLVVRGSVPLSSGERVHRHRTTTR